MLTTRLEPSMVQDHYLGTMDHTATLKITPTIMIVLEFSRIHMDNTERTWQPDSRPELLPSWLGTTKDKLMTTPVQTHMITSLKWYGKTLRRSDVPTKTARLLVGACTLFVSTTQLET